MNDDSPTTRIPMMPWREFSTRGGTSFISHEWGGGVVTIGAGGATLICPRSDVVEFVRQLDEYFNGGPVVVTSKAADYMRAATAAAVEGEREWLLGYLGRFVGHGVDARAFATIESVVHRRNELQPEGPYS